VQNEKHIEMRFVLWVSIAIASLFWVNGIVKAVAFVNPGQMQQKDQWKNEWLLGPKAKIPFSFIYKDRTSHNQLTSWPRKITSKKLDSARTQHTITWTDPNNSLEVRCIVVDYNDFPALEWTVYFKNIGKTDSPILKNIQGLDAVFQRDNKGEFVLHGIKGDWTTADSFQPYQITLGKNAVKNFTPSNNFGKSTSGPDGWPYFNLQMSGGGVILAIGWPGQWSSSFTRNATNSLRITAGQQLTNLYLKPGEQIRTPLIVMLFWQGEDYILAQNLWRRWYTAHNMPRINGQTQQPITQIQVGASEKYIPYVEKFLQAGINPDICWSDAGWYPIKNGPYKDGNAWLNTGTWQPDPERYPHGFKPFSDWVHAHGMQFLLWFEPERVGDPNSWLGRNHPEWLLPGMGQGLILNEGNPAALDWLTNYVDGMIKSEGIDWYREDMNGDGPLVAWRNNDTPDRKGITENFYVQGHLAYWDELRRRNPGLRIDSCASGGRRNDIETMRRAVPLTRSDFQFPYMKGVVEGNQCHTYGLSFWLPFYGNGCYFYDKYSYRSFYMPLFGMGGLTEENIEAQKPAYSECRRVALYMLGDYYPLTPYTLQSDAWIAWQFNRPEKGDGVIQSFRRPDSAVTDMTFNLQGLELAATYTITNFDGGSHTKTGSELMDSGLLVNIPKAPGSSIITYMKH